jgi:hypothetical protein
VFSFHSVSQFQARMRGENYAYFTFLVRIVIYLSFLLSTKNSKSIVTSIVIFNGSKENSLIHWINLQTSQKTMNYLVESIEGMIGLVPRSTKILSESSGFSLWLYFLGTRIRVVLCRDSNPKCLIQESGRRCW